MVVVDSLMRNPKEPFCRLGDSHNEAPLMNLRCDVNGLVYMYDIGMSTKTKFQIHCLSLFVTVYRWLGTKDGEKAAEVK